MYVSPNFKTKKAFKEAVKAGEYVEVFQPGGLFPPTLNGRGAIEGPHGYHTWYASVEVKNGVVIKIIS